MWKWVRPWEEAKKHIRCSTVSENGKFPPPIPTSTIVSQVMLSPWWLSSSGHMSQAEALATRAWCRSGRNWGTEYFWAGSRGQSKKSNPNLWGEQQGLHLMQKTWTYRRGAGAGGRRRAGRVVERGSRALRGLSCQLCHHIAEWVWMNSCYSHILCPPMPIEKGEPLYKWMEGHGIHWVFIPVEFTSDEVSN